MSKKEWLHIQSWLNKNGIIFYIVPLTNSKFVIEVKVKNKPPKRGDRTYSNKEVFEMYKKMEELKIHYYNHYNKTK